MNPSVLILAVESLPFESVTCLEDPLTPESGFQTLCQESVRFSHAFTPSPMSQPALVSVLSGLWPFEHRVRDNGATRLAAHHVTLAEASLKAGYRTAFLSGGPPVFRKSGIAQGFEFFDDNIGIHPGKYFRNFRESSKILRSWLKSEARSSSFFAVIYSPDLQIFDEPILDERGRVVEKSYNGRLQRLDTSIGELFSFLKSERRWEGSYIILMGLNGYSDAERFNEIPSTNLHVENTQVALIIKPPRKKRDLGISWSIDNNVSLIDVSKTLFNMFGQKSSSKQADVFPIFDLMSAIQSPNPDLPNERLIPFETNWPVWKSVGPLRVGLRGGQHLYLSEGNGKLFNTLTDRLELNPTGVTSDWSEKLELARRYFPIERWDGIPQRLLHHVDVAINIWDPSGRTGYLQKENEMDPVIAGWLALRAIENRNWSHLLELGRVHRNAIWELLAKSNIDNKPFYPENRCIKWALKSGFDPSEAKDCRDTMFINLVGWIRNEQINEDSHIVFKEAFVRSYRNLVVDRRIAQLNYVNGLAWDVHATTLNGPTLSEIYLNYPENKKYAQQLSERIRLVQEY